MSIAIAVGDHGLITFLPFHGAPDLQPRGRMVRPQEPGLGCILSCDPSRCCRFLLFITPVKPKPFFPSSHSFSLALYDVLSFSPTSHSFLISNHQNRNNEVHWNRRSPRCGWHCFGCRHSSGYRPERSHRAARRPWRCHRPAGR